MPNRYETRSVHEKMYYFNRIHVPLLSRHVHSKFYIIIIIRCKQDLLRFLFILRKQRKPSK